MSADVIISVQNVGKAYRMWESPASRLTAPLMEAVAKFLPGAGRLKDRAASRYRDFWALKDISFQIKKGEAVGIIGRNGSGKSTLLQIIAGTLQPTEGTVLVKGRVAALLELGSGFNPEFTGRENVFLNAAVLGLDRAETAARFPAIAAFADIGDFIDQPVKTYSSGMMVRLAFAVQTAVEPEILIVDEALSVGDFFFQQKCFKRIAELRARGTTLLFVSHDMGSVRDLCQNTLYLQLGRQVDFGESQHAISLYLREETSPASPAVPAHSPAPSTEVMPSIRLQEIREGALWVHTAADTADEPRGVAQIMAVRVLDAQRRPNIKLRMGQPAVIQAYILVHENASLHFAVEIKNRQGQVVSSLGTRPVGLAPVAATRGQLLEFEAELELGLEAGEYSLQAVLGLPDARANVGTRAHATPWLGPVTISWDYEQEPAPFLGMFHLHSKIKFAVSPTHPAGPA